MQTDSDREEGSLALELAIAFPALLLIVMTMIQYGLLQHGRHVALAVAQRAAREGRAYAPGAGTGQRVSMAASVGVPLLTTLGGNALSNGKVSTSVSGQQVIVVVTGKVNGPFGSWSVSEKASGPIEQVEPEAGP